MNIDELSTRIQELDKAIVNSNQQLFILHGHRAEADFHLQEMKKAEEPVEAAPELIVE